MIKKDVGQKYIRHGRTRLDLFSYSTIFKLRIYMLDNTDMPAKSAYRHKTHAEVISKKNCKVW